MPEFSFADLIPQIVREWEAIDLAGVAASFAALAEKLEDMMDGWISVGECYVKPIDWDELWLVEPQGVVYAAYRHHLSNGQRIAVGTGSSPARAARLLTEAVRAAAGEVDQEESRRNHGLAPREPRDTSARRRVAMERLRAEQAEREVRRSERLAQALQGDVPGRPVPPCAPYNADGFATTVAYNSIIDNSIISDDLF